MLIPVELVDFVCFYNTSYSHPDRMHGTNGIFTYIWMIFMVNVGASPMDPLGISGCTYFDP